MSTQLFLSWSGELSRKVATQLHEWIPTVLQSVEPFLSSTDIEKGSRWSDHVAQKLEECGFGIIVLTPDNTSAPWILFEAGALSKMVGRSHVSSLLIQLNLVDVKQPLSQFQNTIFDRDDVQKLLQSINKTSPSPLRDEVLQRTFAALWPEFDSTVGEIVGSHVFDPQELAPKEDDLANLKDSVGELIQTVQALRDNSRAYDNASLKEVITDLRLDIRRNRGLIPRGLVSEVRSALQDLREIEQACNNGKNTNGEVISDIITRLARASRWLERHTPRFDDYSLGSPLRRDIHSGTDDNSAAPVTEEDMD